MVFLIGVLTITAALVYASYVQVHETDNTDNTDDE